MSSNRKNNSSPLALYLEGFQLIEKQTKFDFGPITLLYGPNSAGKSSILDALELSKKLFNHPNKIRGEFVDHDNYGIDTSHYARMYDSDIQKHWRQTGPEEDISSYFPTMSLGVELDFGPSVSSDTCTVFSKFHSIHEVGPASKAKFGCYRDFEIHINNEMLFTIKEFNQFIFNFNHSYITKNHSTLHRSVSSYSYENTDFLSIQNGNLIFTNSGEHSGIWIDALKRIDIDQFFFNSSVTSGKNNRVLSDLDLITLQSVIELYNQLVCKQIPNIELPDLVAASRTIPSCRDLTVYVPPGGQFQDTETKKLDEFRPITPNGVASDDSPFFEIALSFAEKLPNFYPESLTDDDTPLFEKINNSLSHELFTDKAYQLHAVYSLNISYKNYSEMIESEKDYDFREMYLENHGVFVRILLKDANGVILNFNDVGSGIGYALPVLLNVHSTAMPYIQQPELHLHPALQSALADVFVNASKDGWDRQIIVETHSEHLLLRLLKRVRETASGRILDDSKKLMGHDIKIYYFDPQIDGSTNVKNIRIARNGEFMDRWPKGFFEERYSELFDE